MIAATVAMAAMALLFVLFGVLATVGGECDGKCPGCPAAHGEGRAACEHYSDGRSP